MGTGVAKRMRVERVQPLSEFFETSKTSADKSSRSHSKIYLKTMVTDEPPLDYWC